MLEDDRGPKGRQPERTENIMDSGAEMAKGNLAKGKTMTDGSYGNVSADLVTQNTTVREAQGSTHPP